MSNAEWMTEPDVAERLERVERALTELTDAILLITRSGPAHFEDAREAAQRAKSLLPRDAS